jgi:Domain of unknown function (DUF1735)
MKKIIKMSLFVLLVSTLFVACLKDKDYEDGKYGIKDVENGAQIIELPQAAVELNISAVDPLPAIEDITKLIEVNLAYGKPASEDITVTLVPNNTIITDYNTKNSTSYELMPTNTYQFVNPGALSVTIPKGSQRGYVAMRVNKANFDLSKVYALGFSIATVSPANKYIINQNFKNILVSVQVKNKYDGAYTVTGIHNRPGVGVDFPYKDVDVEMHTTGASSVRFYFNAVNSYGHPIGTGPGTLSWYGAAIGPNLTIDPNTNLITAANNLGGATVISLDPSVTTHRVKWNTATNKPDSIFVTWRYNNNQDRRFFDTLAYVGPR